MVQHGGLQNLYSPVRIRSSPPEIPEGRILIPALDQTARLRTDAAAWDDFVAAAAAPSFLQATPWAAVKRPNGWRIERIVADAAGGPVGGQVLVRRIGPFPLGFGYAPRGPLAGRPLGSEGLEAFTKAARAAGDRMGASYLRVDPELEDPDGSVAARLRSLGWRPGAEIQPSRTRLLDLSLDEDAIWEGIHRKWRQSIRKGERDARVVRGGIERLADFYRIHAVTIDRVGLPVRSMASFEALYRAYDPAGHAHLLFTEDADGSATGTILLLGWGNRIVDLYGGTTEAGRRQRANYLIKWEAIKQAKAAGYTVYDLWGLPSEAVSAFKAGWGGREVVYVGAWDLVLNPVGRLAFEGAVRARARWLRFRGRAASSPGLEAT